MPPGAPGQQPPGMAQLPAQPGTPSAMPPGTAGLPAGGPQLPAASGVMPPQHQQQGSQAQLPMGSHAGLPGSPAQLQAPGGPAGLAAQQVLTCDLFSAIYAPDKRWSLVQSVGTLQWDLSIPV